jgi:hypothetical protein
MDAEERAVVREQWDAWDALHWPWSLLCDCTPMGEPSE